MMKKILFTVMLLWSLQFSYAQCWRLVEAGSGHSMGIKQDGSLWAWGYNQFGQLGLGNTNNYFVPTQVGFQANWSKVSGGDLHTLAIRTDGILWSWGASNSGALGYSASTSIANPVQVGSDNNWVEISAGLDFSLAIKSDGSLWAFGTNNYGQCGVGSSSLVVLTPTRVGTDNNWSKVSAGYYHSAAIKTDGTLYTWGRNNAGQLGNGNIGATSTFTPQQIGTATDWRSISLGEGHSVALKTNNTIWCWGWNQDGQIGNGTQVTVTAPLQIGSGNTWSIACAGARHTIGTTSNGNIWGWGNNTNLQVTGTLTSPAVINPSLVSSGTTPWISFSSGGYHNLAITNTGVLWTSGANNAGQLGVNNSFIAAQAFTALSCPTTTLPVTFKSFSGNNKGSTNQLSWLTTNEINNKGFDIERSEDGINFSRIGFVASSNYSSGSYSFLDYAFVKSTNYYRLKQLDHDGKFTYSSIIAISKSKNDGYSIYPVPAKDYLMIAGEAVLSHQVRLVSANGKIEQPIVQANKLNIQHLASGMYTLLITDKSGVHQLKFIRQ